MSLNNYSKLLGGRCWDSPADCSHLRQFRWLRWESTLKREAKKYSCSAVRCASLLSAQHVTWSRLRVQSRWHGQLQWTGPLHSTDGINRIQKKSQVCWWTWEHNRKVTRDSYWGSCHHIKSQHVIAIQHQLNNFQKLILYTFLFYLI